MTTQDHTSALLPCPFCGGKALLTEKKHYSLVNCGSIHCDMDAGCKAQRMQDAIAAWNTRAQPQQPAGWILSEDDVHWVVNDIAELGVKIGNQFFFLYKGHSLVYQEATHDDGSPMHWRPVFKREFGECAHPINYSDPTKIGTVSLDDSDDWLPLPAAALAHPSQQEDDVLDTPQAQRFVVLKARGSRYAYVNDTLLGKTVKRYDILRGDGWADAELHAARLNRDAAMTAAQGDAVQGGGKNG